MLDCPETTRWGYGGITFQGLMPHYWQNIKGMYNSSEYWEVKYHDRGLHADRTAP